jgi:hypothetical protein
VPVGAVHAADADVDIEHPVPGSKLTSPTMSKSLFDASIRISAKMGDLVYIPAGFFIIAVPVEMPPSMLPGIVETVVEGSAGTPAPTASRAPFLSPTVFVAARQAEASAKPGTEAAAKTYDPASLTSFIIFPRILEGTLKLSVPTEAVAFTSHITKSLAFFERSSSVNPFSKIRGDLISAVTDGLK